MSERVQISRDPFARTTITREVVKVAPYVVCQWCGQSRKSSKLFRYWVESDGGRSSEVRGLFCSKSCCNSYHGN